MCERAKTYSSFLHCPTTNTKKKLNTVWVKIFTMKETGSFSFHPTSYELQYISVTSGFTRLSMTTKYVYRGLISLYVNFPNNRTMPSINLYVKNCRWGEKEEEPRNHIIIKNFFETAELENSMFFWLFLLPPPPPANIYQ